MTWGCTSNIVSSNGNENQSDQSLVGPNGPQIAALRVFALDSNGLLLLFGANAPGQVLNSITPTGLQAGEKLVSLDFRPKTGVLYGLGSTGRLYYIDTFTGRCFNVLNAGVPSGVAIVPQQAQADIDFDPKNDVVRLVSGSQFARINPNDGTLLAVDPAVTFTDGGAAPNIVACAYENNNFGTATSRLFVVDASRDQVLLSGINPNSGIFGPVHSLNFDTNNNVGFDIAQNNLGVITVNANGQPNSKVLIFDPATPKVLPFTDVGHNVPLVSVAVEALPPGPTTFIGLDRNNNLVRFNAATPATLNATVPITGLGGEIAEACDFRPSDESFVVFTRGGKTFTVDLATGAATDTTAGTVAGLGVTFPATATGAALTNVTAPNQNQSSAIGADFNPVANRLRVTNSLDYTFTNAANATDNGTCTNNFRVNVAPAGLVTLDGFFNYIFGDSGFVDDGAGNANPNKGPLLNGPGYTRNFAGAADTRLFAIDHKRDVLVEVVTPNSGATRTVGGLSVPTTSNCGLDFTPRDEGWAVVQPDGLTDKSVLCRVDQNNGQATPVSQIGGGTLRDFTIVPPGK